MKRVTGSCPLGAKCEDVEERDGEKVLVICPWYVEMRGQDATGKDQDSWRCAIAWQPILQVEMASASRNVAASVQSFRNENIKRQDAALQALESVDAQNIKAI